MVGFLQCTSALLCVAAVATASPTSEPAAPAAAIKARKAPVIPNGKKAGSAGGRAVPHWKDHIGWWYDWSPKPSGHDEVMGVSMLWGDGEHTALDGQRFRDFQNLHETPQYVLGFNEPDCPGPDSASMSVDKGVSVWNRYIAPKGRAGALLGSPAMCKQKDEDWLGQFRNRQLDADWDFTAIHVYKSDMGEVQADIDHYWNKYKKPIWVTEFACVHNKGEFVPCKAQWEINQFINDVVDLFEKNEHVMAYGYTDGGGLGNLWLPTNNDGSQLSESGRTYLNAIKKYN